MDIRREMDERGEKKFSGIRRKGNVRKREIEKNMEERMMTEREDVEVIECNGEKENKERGKWK